MKLLEGKVAIVTGAGGGLGRSHALAFAAEGAKVVVNDPGAGRDGTGTTHKMADAVVDEIKRAGGEAAANYDSVATTEGAEAIVKTAVETFGRVDILVNNAGILRDKTIHNMTDDMWDLVLAVHLRGTFACTRAAARVMKEKGAGGRIINTTSVAGLKGNFGQSNYSAAKAGIYGFTLTSAMEFGKDGITVNAIAPLAKTRMTENIDTIPAEYRPEEVSPVVVFLASDLAKDVTGRIIGVHGRHLFEYHMETSGGKEKKDAWTPSEISTFLHAPPEAAPAPPAAPTGGSSKIAAVFKALPSGFDAAKSEGWDALMHFAITGAGDWTVEVKAKTLRVAEGKPASSTSVITVDAETMVGMIDGRVKGDMAFMAGKLKATNVRDLGKFGKVFDFKKINAATASSAPAAPASAPATAGKVDVAALLQRMPGQFLPDKAAGFNGTLLFKADGSEAALEIKDKTCTVRPGVASPTCTLTTDGTTLAGVLEGTIDGQKAFSEGKIKVTHLPSWMKFRQVFKFEAEKGLHRSLVGRTYRAAAMLVRPERLAGYDTVVGDTGSPVFPVTLVRDLFMKFVEDPEFNGDLSRMVHGEQVFSVRRPIQAWDLLSPRARVLGIEDKSSGQILNLGQQIYCEGELVVEMESRLFFRGESKGEKSAAAVPPAKPAPPPPASAGRPVPTSTFTVAVAVDHPKRYADVSGDTNPIHLDEALAKSVGFKGVIMHGLGTLALVVAKLPKPLERLSVRFAKPVYPGETLTTSIWRKGNALEFETANPAGEIVLANGTAVVRS
jgi:NAD(P)-dependent dehydrogenase (short-subunit alcohol dehydrogenase family)/acyl dehydratase/putative sterol carrier protein